MSYSMATSLSNFLSFLLPSKPPPPPSTPPKFPSIQVQTQKPRYGSVPPLALEADSTLSSSSSTELSSVICPSLAYANTLFFKSAYNVQVIVDDNEPEERLLNRFRREVLRAGVIQESKRRRFFENKQDEKKRKSREAAKRNRKRRPQLRASSPNSLEVPTNKQEDEEDNWDLPEGDIPY